jgi:hypothetical protein
VTPENLESEAAEGRGSAFEVPRHSEKSGAVLIKKTWESLNRFRATVWTDSTSTPRLEVRGRCGWRKPGPRRVKTVRGRKTEWPWASILPCSAELCPHGAIWEAQVYGGSTLVLSRAESYDAALLEGRRLAALHGLEEVEEWP